MKIDPHHFISDGRRCKICSTNNLKRSSESIKKEIFDLTSGAIKMIGEYEVANTYTAKCYYATKQRVDYPNTYTVIAEYFGTATKTEEHPITYVVKYEKEEPDSFIYNDPFGFSIHNIGENF